MSISKTDLTIFVKEQAISGRLVMAGEVWTFYAQDPEFIKLFPSGSVCSFSTERELEEPARKEVHTAVAARVKDL